MFSVINTIWVLVAAALIFFMQAGFAMVETGFTRAKNSSNMILKNLVVFCFGSLAFWVVGFGFMHGESIGGFLGAPDFFINNDYTMPIPKEAFIIYQTVFCAVSAVIVSGAMAERAKFITYCIYSIIICGFVYPVAGHWVWGGGWLSDMGYHDFAGASVIHVVGGVAAFMGAKMLGARRGKYSDDGESRVVPGHNIPLGALGILILWFCWFGFAGGAKTFISETDGTSEMASAFLNINFAAVSALAVSMIITWLRYKKPDVSVALNGALAGLVAITAGADVVSIRSAVLIGMIAGTILVFGIEFIDKIIKVDDPIGVITVHGICGAVGILLVGVFSKNGGLVSGGGAALLRTQGIGVLVIGVWAAVCAGLLFKILKSTIGIRVPEQAEITGLDMEEHGIFNSYADFAIIPSPIGSYHNRNISELKPVENEDIQEEIIPIEDAVPVEYHTAKSNGVKITKLTIITRVQQLEALKSAMEEIGITGMTVLNVLGCGMQKGATEYYRGVSFQMTLLQKVQVDIVVCKISPKEVIETAKKVLYTGKYGDGKIFVFDVENVVKVRTGEEGYDALQDEETQ